MTGDEATASCPQVLAIPDANIVLGEAAEPAQADGLADATVWPGMPNLRSHWPRRRRPVLDPGEAA